MRRAMRAPVANSTAGAGTDGKARSAALLCGIRDHTFVSLPFTTTTSTTTLTPTHARWFSSAKSKWGVVNGDIQARVVQLVDDDGKIMPNVPVNQALAEAKKRGVDLVQVSSNGDQVVCRMFDAKKRLFSMKKAAKPQKPKQDKEVVFGVKIEGHDIKVKVEQVKKFLTKGHKVKVTVKFAQQYHLKTKSLEQIKLIEESIGVDVGVADQAPREQFGGVYTYFAPAAPTK
ncbi:Translation initiation factor if-3, partial [Globisporangium splendens]